MEKKVVKFAVAIKPLLTISLKEKLIAAVNKVLRDNKLELTDKIQKVVNKSIKKIVEKTYPKTEKKIKSLFEG